jgi:hypothetical protein
MIQTGMPPSFEHIAYSQVVNNQTSEIQIITASWSEGVVRGFYSLSFIDPSIKVKISCDDSADDFVRKLKLLPRIGIIEINIERGDFQVSWTISFLSNAGDLEMLQIHDQSSMVAVGATIQVDELVKGESLPNRIRVTLPATSTSYIARVAASNEAGLGDFSSAIQHEGKGMQPLFVDTLSSPRRSTLALYRKNDNEIEAVYDDSIGDGVFKMEWVPGSTFGNGMKIKFTLTSSLENDMYGSFQIKFHLASFDEAEISSPIYLKGISAQSLMTTLENMNSMGSVVISDVSVSTFIVSWVVLLSQDMGSIGKFSLITNRIKSARGDGQIDTDIQYLEEPTPALGYGFEYLYSDDCQSWTLGESSPIQYISLMADADETGSPIASGTFKIQLGDESSQCVSFDATSLEIKTALMNFDGVTDVEVIVHSVSASNQFQFAYSIVFKTLPKNDLWPELSIDPYNFGKGDCAAFSGGSMHRGIAFPIKERAFCTKSTPTSIVIAMKGTNSEGTFRMHYRDGITNEISIDGSAQFIKDEISKLSDNFSLIDVVKKDKYAGDGTSAWVVRYTTKDTTRDEIQINDDYVSGQTSLHVYPLLNITSVSQGGDFAGDYRIQFGNRITNPISVRATNNKIVVELLKLQGIGSVEMIESEDGISSVDLEVLTDDSLVYSGLPSLVAPGDFTSVIARGDLVSIGSCTNLQIRAVQFQSFDSLSGVRAIFTTKYSDSESSKVARSKGYTILSLSLNPSVQLSNYCSQAEGDTVPIQIGKISSPQGESGRILERLIAIKGSQFNLNDFNVIPEHNWRGTRSQIFAEKPFQTWPSQYILQLQ